MRLVKTRPEAPGIPWRSASSCENAFEDSMRAAACARTECGDPLDGQAVYQAPRERVLRPDDDQVGTELLRGRHLPLDVRRLDVDVRPFACRAGVAGGDEEIGQAV